tara:strand:+ start:41 stop:259 length:219 start_codon:yes stop_codon:yes gene_type:complete
MENAHNTIEVLNRDSLNDIIKDRLCMKVSATDEQWQQVVDSIHNDDETWDYINSTVDRAVNELIDPLVNSLK